MIKNRLNFVEKTLSAIKLNKEWTQLPTLENCLFKIWIQYLLRYDFPSNIVLAYNMMGECYELGGSNAFAFHSVWCSIWCLKEIPVPERSAVKLWTDCLLTWNHCFRIDERLTWRPTLPLIMSDKDRNRVKCMFLVAIRLTSTDNRLTHPFLTDLMLNKFRNQ